MVNRRRPYADTGFRPSREWKGSTRRQAATGWTGSDRKSGGPRFQISFLPLGESVRTIFAPTNPDPLRVCFQLGREFAGSAFHHGEQYTLARRTKHGWRIRIRSVQTTRAQAVRFRLAQSAQPFLSMHGVRFRTPSTFDTNSSPDPHCGFCEPKRLRSGRIPHIGNVTHRALYRKSATARPMWD